MITPKSVEAEVTITIRYWRFKGLVRSIIDMMYDDVLDFQTDSGTGGFDYLVAGAGSEVGERGRKSAGPMEAMRCNLERELR